MDDRLNGLTEAQKAILLKKLREKKLAAAKNENNLIKHDPANNKEYQVSYNQESILMVEKLYNHNTIYNIGGIAKIKGSLNLEAFSAAFDLLVEKHDILRTVFEEREGKSVARTLESTDFAIGIVDYSGRRDEANDFILSERDKPFDLKNAPAYRVDAIKLEDEEWMIVLVIHHLLADGASTGIIFKELIQYYEAGLENKTIENPKETITYGDFSLWQKSLRDEKLNANYWKDRLSGTDFQLEFFSRCSGLKQLDHESSRINFEIDEARVGQLQVIAKEKKITLFSLLLGAFYITLYKYSGQKDLVCGVLTSGRDNAEIAGLIGCFISALPIKTEIRPEVSTIEYCKDLYQQFLKDYQHREELMVYENESLEHQILFSYEEDPENHIEIKSLDMSFEEIPSKFCRSEMEIELNRLKGKIRGWINYRSHLFEHEFVEQFVNHFKVALGIIAASPETLIKDIELVQAEEREQIIHRFNPPKTEFERESSIIDLFENQVDAHPEKTALFMGDKTLSYIELDNKANAVANTLIENGVKPKDKVAIICNRGFDMLAGILGILKIGCTYVPVDAEIPDSRKEFILNDSKCTAIIWDRNDYLNTDLVENLPAMLIQDCYEKDTKRPAIKVAPDTSAYIIYTSGTTGIPKGVEVSHRNVLRTMRHTNYADAKDDDRLIGLSSYAFDASIFDFFYTLLNGLGLVIVSKNLQLDIPRLIDEIESKKVTIMFVTTAFFNALIDIKPEGLKGLRRILFGGERASVMHVKKAIEVIGSGKVANIYGPTETTVFATYWDINEDLLQQEIIPIGKPLSNTTVRIVNEDGNINPVGVAGEILIGGEGVSKGYRNNPELTAQKFIVDKTGERFYRTGDLGRYMTDGKIAFCGRVDDQVKYRGFRIELGEIESAILSFDEIKQAIVVLSKDEKLGAYLCAYYVPSGQIKIEALKKSLREKLPAYMIPNYFVELQELPLNVNGKVDKKKLPKPELIINDDYVAPNGELEEALADIWEEVLGVDTVGTTDNFFELGGHSIKLAKMCALANERLDLEIPLRIAFQNPTISTLCNYLENQEQSTDTNFEYKIEKTEKSSRYEASPTQKRMVFAHMLDKSSVSYNIPFAVKLKGVDTKLLGQVFNEIIEKHEILRTRFSVSDGTVYQIVEEPFKYEIKTINTLNTITEYFNQFITSFDLNELPLFRVELVKTPDDETYLLGDFHHSIFDGVSMQVLFEDLSTIYNGEKLENPKLQYRDFAAWHNKFLSSKTIENQGQYWKKRFENFENTPELPLDFARPAHKTGKGEVIFFSIDEELTKKLRAKANNHKTTLNVVLMSMYHVLLSHYTGSDEIVTGMAVAGRRQESLQRMMGMCLNTLAIRSNPTAAKSIYDYIEEFKTDFVKDFDNQDYPFEKLVEDLGIPKQINRNPIFDTMFIMQNSVKWDFNFDGSSFSLCDLDYKTSKFDMQMEVYEESNHLKCLVAYADDLFYRSTIEGFIDAYKAILTQAVENESMLLGDISLGQTVSPDMINPFAVDLIV
ncbi:amino acid adenylation domain-containing protein [Pseudobutyrivibrio sp. ACV-2]|uniref:non-ribosomal peptide synthetase n=1 Tax=Pseudobutyrivibrio sp. ACV-2 TaxID=1520801 RepID=UPI0008944F0A|nr:non-ribosomal peptide synthetase [Pseudobutyrivibrio sp. ACV-2]SEA06566.1 amino acid adenylation domain-containing protein [Pseudobutyrivibrio sp. ACV-2]